MSDKDKSVARLPSRTDERLRAVPRLMKQRPSQPLNPQPGAYPTAGRAEGERPAWSQRAAIRQMPLGQRFPFVVEDAEVVLSDGRMPIADVQEIVRATAVVESRVNGFHLRNLNPMVRRRRRREVQMAKSRMAQPTSVMEEPQVERSPKSQERKIDSTNVAEETGSLPSLIKTIQIERNDEDNNDILQGSRRTRASLIDDDDSDEEIDTLSRERMTTQRGLLSMSIHENEEFSEDHPHVQSVLEVFPDTDITRVQELLRQESLSTTFITLAEESSAAPSDSVACPTELQHTTTYAQANDENRAIIMSYLMEMFPHIPMKKIEKVVMKYSTHKGVAILSGEGTELNPTTPARKYTAPNGNRDHQRSLDFSDLYCYNDRKQLESSLKPASVKKQTSSTYDEILEQVLRESALEEERRQAKLQNF